MSAEHAAFRAGWALTLYPTAGEAGGCFVSSRRRPHVPHFGPAADPDRSRLEAGRRARAKLRRYCAHNGLNRLGTLTYAGQGCHDPRAARADVGEFFRALRALTGGEPFPYAWVSEWHKSGHGLHLHFALGRYVPRHQIESAWGRGFVHIKLLSDVPVGAARLGEARRVAGYLSKYVSKTFLDDQDGVRRPQGLHRFDVAQGFRPPHLRLTDTTADGVLALAEDVMGMPAGYRWSSLDVEGWKGPPAIFAQWV
jgi:hypothetical protein